MTHDGEMIEGWRLDQERRGLMPRTIYKRCSQVRSFARWTADGGGLLAAGQGDVQRFLDARRIGSRTRYHWISTLHCFYRWAASEGHTDADPTARIVRPRLRRSLPRPVSDADLTVSLQMASPQMRAWLTLAALGGLRCAEIGRLRVEDVLDAGAALRLIGKGDKERIVPLHPDAYAAMRAAGIPRRGHLYLRPGGGPYPPNLVSRTISEYLRGIGVDATAHQYRHWFGTKAYAASGDIRVVQELMGHSSPTVTAGYAAFSEVTARRAVLALRVEGGAQAQLPLGAGVSRG